MKVLVIGGTGNISASIVQRLLQCGHKVSCFNRGIKGVIPQEVEHIRGDKRDHETFESMMRKRRFDAVIDMICFTAADASSNIRAFPEVGQFVQCSTTCTYGVHYDWLPVTEDHPLRPITDYGRGKAEADRTYMDAYAQTGFPVTIIKPSTTYGPLSGLFRHIGSGRDGLWIDRVRKGKPIAICGDGQALHQFLHVDDAAKGFVGALGKQHCIGQSYNLVNRGYITWENYHKLAMKVIGREVEVVGIPVQELTAIDSKRFALCNTIFAFNCYYSAEKIFRDIPEFRSEITLEQGMERIIAHMDSTGRIVDSDTDTWEDRLIEAQMRVRNVTA